jgi:hypothetical protein
MVLLYLLRAALAKHLFDTTGRAPMPSHELRHITFVYFDGGNNFDEMTEFIAMINEQYERFCFVMVGSFLRTLRFHINLSVRSDSIKHGLQVLLEQRPDLKGIFQGVRRTDPYSGMQQTRPVPIVCFFASAHYRACH